MKKIFNVFFVFIVLLCPLVVKAASISISCGSIINNAVTCDITGNTDQIIIAVSAKVRTNSNLSFASFSPSSIWQGDGSDGSIELYTADDIIGNFSIGTLNLNVTSVAEGYNTSAVLESVFFSDVDGNDIKIDSVSDNIRIKSSINDLASLSINNGSLSPNFDKNTVFYSSTIDSNSVVISATTENKYANISGDIGTKNLSYGNNTFKINVTSEDGNTKTYTINIVRPEKNNNADNSASSNNSANNKSNNAYLKDIVLSIGSIVFDKDTITYDINVPYVTEKIEVNALAEDSKAKVEISGNDKLNVGENKITIKVTAEDNTTKEYIVNVTRKEEGYSLSSNNDISNIKIKNYDLKFNNGTLDYTLKIKNEKKLDIEVLLGDSKAKYEIIGNDNLKNNSVIKIVVTAEDNSSKIYNIKIKNNTNAEIVFIIVIAVLLLVNIGRIGFNTFRKVKLERV